MKNHTNNPAERAASIADREAKKVWQETKNPKECRKTWLSVYRQSLTEFGSLEYVQIN